MIKDLYINDKDHIKLENFSLVYRFTDKKFDSLPKNQLNTIKPLSKQKAKQIYDYAKELIGFYIIESYQTQQIETANTPIFNIKEILLSLFNNQDIILSYDEETALITSYKIFCDYWDSFCYPSSDDITIFPLKDKWIIEYFHYEQFLIRSNSSI